MLNKARGKGIKIVQMDESFRLPDERTLDQEKIVRLERQIKELEDRQPLLKLSFLEKGTSLEEVQLNLDILPDQDRQDLINLVEAESKAISWVPSEPTIPKTKTFQRSESDISDISDVINAASTSITNAYHALSKLEIISEIEIDRYQIDSTKYLERYQNYLQNNHSYERRSRLSRPLSFQVINVGTSPAIGTIVSIRFPKALEVFYWDEFPPRPEKPSRPIQPRTQIEKNLIPQRIFDLDASHSAIFLPALDSLNSNIETEVLRISKTNHTLVEWNGLKVLHQIPLPLTILGVVFPDQIGDMNYTLYYEIFAENISYKVEGKLEISVHGEITKKTIPHPM